MRSKLDVGSNPILVGGVYVFIFILIIFFVLFSVKKMHVCGTTAHIQYRIATNVTAVTDRFYLLIVRRFVFIYNLKNLNYKLEPNLIHVVSNFILLRYDEVHRVILKTLIPTVIHILLKCKKFYYTHVIQSK